MIVRAGPLQAEYEGGSIRYVRLGQQEILRHVYVAVRGQNWHTIPARVLTEEICGEQDNFHIRLKVEHISEDVDFGWYGEVTGTEEGTVEWTMAGIVGKPFLRNRIGFCILHPIRECAGRSCLLEHSDGTVKESRFPQLIAPHQPFFDVCSLSYESPAGIKITLRTAGDVFETEDHRNWTDYSFKTYSTPLALPYPVLVTPDSRIQQRVTLVVKGAAAQHARQEEGATRIEVDRSRVYAMPALGCLQSKNESAAHFSHIRVDIRFNDASWKEKLAAAAAHNSPLEIAVFTDGQQQNVRALSHEVKWLGVCARRFLFFTEEGTLTESAVIQSARKELPEAPVGGGSNRNFAELNRNRSSIDSLDFLSWGVNPRVHASDDKTMIENLEGQGATAESARAFAGGRPLRVSIVDVPSFAGTGAWLAGSVSGLAQAGVSSITYSHTHPMLNAIARNAPAQVIHTRSSHPLKAGALAMGSDAGTTLFVANYLSCPQDVFLEGQQVRLEPYEVLQKESG